jgi:hypothetical protein
MSWFRRRSWADQRLLSFCSHSFRHRIVCRNLAARLPVESGRKRVLLRISSDLADDEVILHLEGEVTQPWTDELERMVTALFSDGKRVVLEMSAVRFMDAHAVDIVNMWSQSVVLSNCTPFLKELLKVRALRRE